MKKYLIAVLVSIFVLFPIQTKALICGNEKKVKFQELAKNITINYEYQETDNDVIFNIKIANIPENFILYDMRNHIEYKYQGSEITIPNLPKDTSYKYSVYVNDTTCNNELLYVHYITLPAYNSYYKDPVCSGIEDYKLCSKWLKVNDSYDVWKNKVQNYKDSLNKKPDKDDNKKEITIFDDIINFYVKYYMFILPSIILLCIIGRFIYNKKHDLF